MAEATKLSSKRCSPNKFALFDLFSSNELKDLLFSPSWLFGSDMNARRCAMTLVELLAVIFCVLVIFSLLIPAIDHHKPHRRNWCATQIKNFALASIQYENTKGRFPGYVEDFGTWTAGDVPTDPAILTADPSQRRTHRKIGTWAVALLPWLDAQPTYEHWTQDRFPVVFSSSPELPLSSGGSGDGFAAMAAPNLAIFQCPSDPLKGDYSHGRNSYVCNTGMYHRQDGKTVVGFAESMTAANGVFNNKFAGLDRSGQPVPVGPPVTLNDFPDGQSYTMLITENLQAMPWHRAGLIDAADLLVVSGKAEIDYQPTSRFTTGVVWHHEDDALGTGAEVVKPVHRINGAPAGGDRYSLTMTTGNAADLARPSSAHTANGVNMGMADGSTRFVSETIDYRVYQALLTPDGAASDVPMPSFVLPPEVLE